MGTRMSYGFNRFLETVVDRNNNFILMITPVRIRVKKAELYKMIGDRTSLFTYLSNISAGFSAQLLLVSQKKRSSDQRG